MSHKQKQKRYISTRIIPNQLAFGWSWNRTVFREFALYLKSIVAIYTDEIFIGKGILNVFPNSRHIQNMALAMIENMEAQHFFLPLQYAL